MTFSGPLGGEIPLHSEDMRTSNPHVLIAGDLTGVEEASTALDEGRLAGVTASILLGKLGGQEGEDREAQLKERITSLRQGAFGDRRRLLKEEIWEQYAAKCAAETSAEGGQS